MLCLTDLLSKVTVIIRPEDIQTMAPIAGGIGSLVLMEGGTKFYVSETPEVILIKLQKNLLTTEKQTDTTDINEG